MKERYYGEINFFTETIFFRLSFLPFYFNSFISFYLSFSLL